VVAERAVLPSEPPVGSAPVVDEHGVSGREADDATADDGERRQERVALEEIEAALVDVAGALARMG